MTRPLSSEQHLVVPGCHHPCVCGPFLVHKGWFLSLPGIKPNPSVKVGVKSPFFLPSSSPWLTTTPPLSVLQVRVIAT